MKKILSAICAAAMLAVCVSQNVFAAGNSNIEVKNEANASVKYFYDSEKSQECVKSIKELIDLSKLMSSGKVTQTISVCSESAGGKVVDIAVRLSVEKFSAKEDYSIGEEDVLNYYDITVTDEDGDLIYTDSHGDYKPSMERDIPLGIFNSTNGHDVRTYKITQGKLEHSKCCVGQRER